MSDTSTFGVELRRARLAAGVSLGELAVAVHFSKGHLSKLENGAKRPTPDLARRCDAVLGAGGRLAATVPPPGPATPGSGTAGPRAPGAGALGPGAGPGRPGSAPPEWAPPRWEPARPRSLALAGADATTLEALAAAFHLSRGLGRAAGPPLVLPALVAQIRCLEEIAAAGPGREALLVLAARSAEYAGWMTQECGDDAGARWWTDRAVRFALAAGDRELARYGLVRQAEICLHRRELAPALTLLAGARDGGRDPRVSGLAVQWEAQAYALAGDERQFAARMDRAADLLAAAAADSEMLGSTLGNQPVLVRGWCLLELGRPDEAADLLDREVPRIPAASRRAAARFGARRALARAAAGDAAGALELLPDLLELAARVDSATVRVDLHRLRRELARWDARPEVADARADLADALLPY